MKKLYSYKKSKIHPSSSVPSIDDYLALLLPTAILTLTSTLSFDDKQVLAYLIASTNSSALPNFSSHCTAAEGNGHNSTVCVCNCFCCYKSFWVKWDASPNRELIHEIIEAFEETGILVEDKKKTKKKTKKKRSRKIKKDMSSLTKPSSSSSSACSDDDREQDRTDEQIADSEELVNGGVVERVDELNEGDGEICVEKGAIRKVAGFIQTGFGIFGNWIRSSLIY